MKIPAIYQDIVPCYIIGVIQYSPISNINYMCGVIVFKNASGENKGKMHIVPIDDVIVDIDAWVD